MIKHGVIKGRPHLLLTSSRMMLYVVSCGSNLDVVSLSKHYKGKNAQIEASQWDFIYTQSIFHIFLQKYIKMKDSEYFWYSYISTKRSTTQKHPCMRVCWCVCVYVCVCACARATQLWPSQWLQSHTCCIQCLISLIRQLKGKRVGGSTSKPLCAYMWACTCCCIFLYSYSTFLLCATECSCRLSRLIQMVIVQKQPTKLKSALSQRYSKRQRLQIKDGLCEITYKSRTCSEISKWALTA